MYSNHNKYTALFVIYNMCILCKRKTTVSMKIKSYVLFSHDNAQQYVKTSKLTNYNNTLSDGLSDCSGIVLGL